MIAQMVTKNTRREWDLHISSQRKKLIQQLKFNKDWEEQLIELIEKGNPNHSVYLSEALTECFKNNHFKMQKLTVDKFVRTLHSNVTKLINCKATSPDHIASLGVSCLGLSLYMKSDYFCPDAVATFSTLSESLVSFIYCHASDGVVIPRGSLILIIPLIIQILVQHKGLSLPDLMRFGDRWFCLPYYNISWKGCMIKVYKLQEHEQNIVLELLDTCTSRLEDPPVWYIFVYLDIIATCLKRYEKLLRAEDERIKRLFNLVVSYSDDKGFNLTSTTDQIQRLCLKICPENVFHAERLCDGPWYSGNTLIYLNLYIQFSMPLKPRTCCVYLESLLLHLGYNRIDHKSLKAIKSLLSRYLCKDMFQEFLEICVSCVETNPENLNLVSVYVLPLFHKPEIFPTDLESYCYSTITSAESTHVQVLLLHGFYQFFKDTLYQALIKSMIPKSRKSEVVCLLISIISKDVGQFEIEFLVDTLQCILTIPCPTVRQHTTSIFPHLSQLSSLQFQEITRVFLDNLTLEAPYHSLALSLLFVQHFAADIILEDGVRKLLLGIRSHSDADIVKAVTAILAEPSPNAPTCPAHSISNLVTEMDTIRDLNDISRSDLLLKIRSVSDKLSPAFLEAGSTLDLSEKCVQLLLRLLGTISDNECKESFVAPSFEETFDIIKAAVCQDEEHCKEVGRLVWACISGLLELLQQLAKELVNISVRQYMKEQDCTASVDELLNIGFASLQCIYRCRHRSVISGACETLKVLSIATAPRPPASHLPATWLGSLLHVLESPAVSSLCRRSGGLPEAVEAVLQCNNIVLTQRTVEALLRTAELPYREKYLETQDVVQVHALHMLRLVLSSAKLRLHLLEYISQVCSLCYSGFVHELWVVRNASFLLFAELVNYILGHKITEFPATGYRSNLSSSELKTLYPGVYNQLLSNLQSAGSSPSIYLSLMLLSVLYTMPQCTDVFGKHLFQLLSCKRGKVRAVAARLITIVCSKDVVEECVRECRGTSQPGTSRNRVNGELMFILECCKANLATISGREVLLRYDLDTMLPLNLSLVVQILVQQARPPLQQARPPLIDPIQHIHSLCAGTRHNYPSDILSHIACYHLHCNNYETVFQFITCHGFHLTQVFWTHLSAGFYESVDSGGVRAMFEALLDTRFRFVDREVGHVIFNILNTRQVPDLLVPGIVREYLSLHISRFTDIGVVLTVSYGIPVPGLMERLVANQPFNYCHAQLMCRIYSIKIVDESSEVSAVMLASALLHCQSEDGGLQEAALGYCTKFANPGLDCNVALRYAMEMGMQYARQQSSVYCGAISRLRERVSSEEGFGNNALFDKTLFLQITHWVAPNVNSHSK